MALNEIGSIASIIALVAMVIGGTTSVIKKYRAYIKSQDESSVQFKTFLVKVVSESTTTSERSDAAALVQHTLTIIRHRIIAGYFKLLTSIAFGSIGFIIFMTIDLNFYAWLFLTGGGFLCVIDYWFIKLLKKDIEHSEWEVGKAWATHLNKARERKKLTLANEKKIVRKEFS